MKVNFATLMLAAAVLTASCSYDDALQDTVNDNDGLKAVTVTATLPEGGMTTRAACGDDAAAARCFVQVLDKDGNSLGDDFSAVQPMTGSQADGFSTTVYLKEGEEYTFLFWADNDQSDRTPNDLTKVSYTNGEVIAWAGKAETTWSADGVTAELKHVVARVTVHTTTAVVLSRENTFTCTVPDVYTAYDVYGGTVIGSSDSYVYTDNISSAEANSDLCHFYVLVDGNNQKLSLHLSDNPAVTVDNVPLMADCHTTLSGDVRNLGLTGGTVTASMNTDWSSDGQIPIEGYTFDKNTNTYTVYTAKGLLEWNKARVADRSTKCKLGADIDFTGYEWITGSTSYGYPFTGIFDGNGHVIYNLNVTGSDSNEISGGGLIGYGSGCIIKDLTLVNPTINDAGHDTGIAGYLNGSSLVVNCHIVGGRITGRYTGGIVGSMRYPAEVIACSSSASITGEYVGGIAGWNNDDGSIIACYATGSVTSTSITQPFYTNGIAGRSNGKFSACYWDVEGAEYGWADRYGQSGTDGAEKVDGTTITWKTAMENMNKALKDADYGDYKWTLNEGEDAEDVPLVLVIK